MNPTSRLRAWGFTLNNYTPDEENYIQNEVSKKAQYIVYGREIAPLTGTPHLQGYVYFTNTRAHHQVRKLLPRCDVRPRHDRSTHENIRDYCKKDGDFFEAGEEPMTSDERNRKGGRKNAERYTQAIEYAETGNMKAIRDSDPQLYIQYHTKLESLFNPKRETIQGPMPHEWWVGDTGTGKSKLLWELYPKHYAKNLNKWWDGYRHEDVVAIEEWSPKNDCTTQLLKKWSDRYPFPAEIKGGCLQGIRPAKLIVLSNYTPQQCFLHDEDLKPMLRRFTVIHFPNQAQHARFRAIDQAEAPLDTPEVTTAEEAMPTLEDLLDDDDESVIDFEDFFQEE